MTDRKWECTKCKKIQKVQPPYVLPGHCKECGNDAFRPLHEEKKNAPGGNS